MLLLPGIQGRSSARVSVLSALPGPTQGIVQHFGAVQLLSALCFVPGRAARSETCRTCTRSGQKLRCGGASHPEMQQVGQQYCYRWFAKGMGHPVPGT